MSLATEPDSVVVACCRRGEDAAWEELVRRYARYVYAITSRGYRLAPPDAEDVFQEVFARTYEHLSRLRDGDALRPWIGQLARRLCVDRLRALARETVAAAEIEPAELDRTLDRLDEALSVQHALATLPEHCREILDRFFARDESYRTIGAALGIPPGTIASRISRCLDKLRTAYAGRSAASHASG